MSVNTLPQVAEFNDQSQLTAEQRQIVIAEIGERKLTLGQLESRLNREPPAVRAQYTTVTKRKQYLANWLHFEVLVMAAHEKGLDKDRQVVESLRSQMVRRFLREAVTDKIKADQISEGEISAYYQGNLQLYQRPMQVELRHLLVSDQGKADRIRAEIKAGANDSAAKLNAIWKDYVSRLSEDRKTAPYLGSLGLITQTAMAGDQRKIPPALLKAAFVLDTYQLSPVIKTERGYHLLLVTSKRPALNRRLSQVSAVIRKLLVKKKRDQARKALLTELRSKASIKMNMDAIRLLPKSVMRWPGKHPGPGKATARRHKSTATAHH